MSSGIELGRHLWECPEGGFQEWRTHQFLVDALTEDGFQVRPFEGIPGFVATITGRPQDCRVAVITDMDALPLGGNEYRHMCGHHQQMTALCTTARLMKTEAPELLPLVSFIALPAEEYVELDRKRELVAAGTITHLSGKQEMLHRGLFARYDAVIATHSAGLPAAPGVTSVRRMGGFDEMKFRFRGQSAHAGAHPHRGRNAQNGAALFLQACAYLRETFNEEDHIRIHPVLRISPDQPVSFVPDSVDAETYVRGATPEVVDQTAEKLTGAAKGAARALGLEVSVDRKEGYKALATNPLLHDLVRETALELEIPFEDELYSGASTDVGDISQQIPAVIVGLPGTNGRFHRPDFQVIDESLAYEFPPAFLVPYVRKVVQRLGELRTARW